MNLSPITQDVSVLINSCDKYADVWPVFFALFWKYWPDCPYQVYLGTNTRTWSDKRVQIIQVGPDLNWADTTIKMVEVIPSPYVLWFLEDFLIWEKVDTPAIESLVEEMKRLNANYLRLRNWPPTYGPVQGHPEIVQISPGAPYRCALEIAFWRREVLLDLLVPGETPWEMEKKGSLRSNKWPGFYSTRGNLFKRSNGLERGKWIKDNLPGLKREKICIPPGHAIMSPREHLFYFLRSRIFSFLISRKKLALALKKRMRTVVV